VPTDVTVSPICHDGKLIRADYRISKTSGQPVFSCGSIHFELPDTAG
jgi:hypothetical protein